MARPSLTPSPVGITSTQAKKIAASFLLAVTLVALLFTVRWPLVGDETIMHYTAFLIRHGEAPYKTIGEINLPGTLAVELLFTRMLGSGAVAWRLYDTLLLLAAAAAYFVANTHKHWFAATMASGLLILIHLQDGMIEVGQRDLLLAVLLLWSCVFLLRATTYAELNRPRPNASLLLTGLLLGITLTIKPTLLPLIVIIATLLLTRREGSKSARLRRTALFLLATSLPIAVAGAWLFHLHVWKDFWSVTVPLIQLHDQLGRRTLHFLLSHALTPLTPLVALWILLLAFMRPRWNLQRIWLLTALLCAIAGYLVQGKGFTYQRYPELAILLLILCRDVDDGLSCHHIRHVRPIAFTACVIAILILPIRFAWLVTTFSPRNDFRQALERSLQKEKIHGQLQGNVQCLDTYGGCLAALNEMQVVQSTGYLYDCYLFTDDSPTSELYRASFWKAYQKSKPRIIVVTDQFCFNNSDGFKKIRHWPALEAELRSQYTLAQNWHPTYQQHFWKRYEQPTSFQIFLRNP